MNEEFDQLNISNQYQYLALPLFIIPNSSAHGRVECTRVISPLEPFRLRIADLNCQLFQFDLTLTFSDPFREFILCLPGIRHDIPTGFMYMCQGNCSSCIILLTGTTSNEPICSIWPLSTWRPSNLHITSVPVAGQMVSEELPLFLWSRVIPASPLRHI
ncbi:hypothetical protein ACN38_g2372 [Penicillium nordicum]|uniref:Uncharacterized protein n=1 Tax=Penicillium nordicum TaxID=229535 RepID=A0A0M9WIY0_9EURO|nr:hypothetical protein ACN38_g2372 [Penicillium nordicum]